MILLNGECLDRFSFPNGETGIKIPPYKGINFIELYYKTDQDLMDLMFLRKYMDQTGNSFPGMDLIISYMPYSRMDRANKDYLFTLKYVCDFINWLAFDRVYVIEPHSDVTCALLDRSHPIWVVEQMLPMVIEAIDFDPVEDYLVFPDAGAQKRYEKIFDGNILVGLKERDFKTGDIVAYNMVHLKSDGSFNYAGRKALIVDDLCSRGGTFVDACGELKHMGFAEKHLLVAHCEPNVYTGDLFDCITSVHATTSLQKESLNPKLLLHTLEDIVDKCLD